MRAEASNGTYWAVVALEDDAGGIAPRVPAVISVLVDDTDGAILRRLRAGLDVAQVETLSVNDAAGAQKTHCEEENKVELYLLFPIKDEGQHGMHVCVHRAQFPGKFRGVRG